MRRRGRKRGRFRLVASPDGADGSMTIHQDARLYLASLLPGQTVSPTTSSRAERRGCRSFEEE